MVSLKITPPFEFEQVIYLLRGASAGPRTHLIQFQFRPFTCDKNFIDFRWLEIGSCLKGLRDNFLFLFSLIQLLFDNYIVYYLRCYDSIECPNTQKTIKLYFLFNSSDWWMVIINILYLNLSCNCTINFGEKYRFYFNIMIYHHILDDITSWTYIG